MTDEVNWAAERGPERAGWDRQPSETSRQFATFCEYRNMHPLERSLAEVAKKLGKSETYVERLSAKFGWVARCAAFDREQDRIGQAQRVRRIDEMNERHAEIAATALQKITERLATIDADSLRPNDIARLLEVASRAERMARGVVIEDPVAHQRGPVFNADEIRRHLKEEGLL